MNYSEPAMDSCSSAIAFVVKIRENYLQRRSFSIKLQTLVPQFYSKKKSADIFSFLLLLPLLQLLLFFFLFLHLLLFLLFENWPSISSTKRRHRAVCNRVRCCKTIICDHELRLNN